MTDIKDQADAALARKGAAEREIKRIELELNEEIDALKQTAKKKSLPYEAAVEKEDAYLEGLALEHRQDLFGAAKSLPLTHGEIGFRSSTALCLLNKRFSWAGILERFDALGLKAFIRTTKELDKDRIKTLHPDQLAEHGLKLRTTEKFFAKPDIARLPGA